MVGDAYFHPAPDGAPSSRAIVLLTDVFGLPLKNCKIMADEFAKRVGCDVWVPDLFAGAWSICFTFYLVVRCGTAGALGNY